MNDHINLANTVLSGVSIAPISVTATTTGTGVDFRNGGSEVVAYVSLGVIASGSTWTLALEQSKNDNTADGEGAADAYTAISGATGAIADTDDGTIIKITTNARSERYVRLVATLTGSGACLMGVNLMSPRRTAGSPQ